MSEQTALTAASQRRLFQSNALKMTLLMAAFVFLAASPTFAASSNSGIDALDTWAQRIKDILTADWVKVICMVALVIEAVMIVVAGSKGAGGGALLSRFGPWVVGTIVLWSASSICSYFLGDLSFD